MIRFRPKLGSEHDREWRCCCFLHVRTGTILLGTWHLLLHLTALVFMAAIVKDPDLANQLQQDNLPDWVNNPPLPTPLSNSDTRPTVTNTQHLLPPRDQSLVYHDLDMSALVTVCTLAITLMLIYGAARGKPAPLLPFFCLQIFDFAITILTATGYLCYLRSIHRLVAETRRVPFKDELLKLDSGSLGFIVLLSFLIAVLIKSYCISMVWRCYKYLTMRAHALQSLSPFIISSDMVAPSVRRVVRDTPPPAVDDSSLLPNYEEAVKQTPPPSYQDATMKAAAAADASASQPTSGTAQPQTAPGVRVVVALPPSPPQPDHV